MLTAELRLVCALQAPLTREFRSASCELALVAQLLAKISFIAIYPF
jgi:hypothetical protein